MGTDSGASSGPDFESGVPLTDIPDGGMMAGHVRGQAVLVARNGDDVFAIGGTCTHYGGPLGDGLRVGDTVRCPWHHACFDLRTGEALRAPALNPVARWKVERRGSSIVVTGEIPAADPLQSNSSAPRTSGGPESVLIVGAGAAGNAAAEMLRRLGFARPITMIGADDSVPYDRPNLSKDYLAGNAPEEWIPLRSREFYAEHDIHLLTGRRVTSIDVQAKRVALDDGSARPFGALLLATGAEPTKLPPTFSSPKLFYLRTLHDSRTIIAAAKGARRAVVLGASFIGLEVAASLRARGVEVHVAAPEARPLERILGPELGDFIRGIHESHGVVFHLGQTASAIEGGTVTLGNGERLEADLVVAGIGVRPNDQLAASAGLAVDRGVAVDEFLQSSAPGIYAAGDIARYPDLRTGARIRVEHWVHAERQGQHAARTMLGARVPFSDVPFFWSQHYDVQVSYVGHAERWDEIVVDGSMEKKEFAVTYRVGGKALAVATVGRDRESLETERSMETTA
jgi:NADPH-dependent 2,4-dienoyl-CoA reductase/sulfur reductase-like enzyme/nitrite reductase/ring-hydroxylating ferredoxin subunit